MGYKPAARILIADDHRLLAEACKSLLEPEFQIVGIVTDGRSLLKAAAAMKPDVIILDIAMPHLNGLDAGDQINHDMPRTALIYLTMSTEPHVAAEAFRRGAAGYVLKQSASDELLIAVRKAVQGESYLSTIIAKETVAFLINPGKQQGEVERITPRQTEILPAARRKASSMKEVASGTSDLKPGTVAFHKYRMMENLGVKTNAELLEYALKRRMIS